MMIEFFESGGVLMWPILICGLLVLGLSAKAAFISKGGPARLAVDGRADVDSVLVWGFSAAVLGVLGTLIGMMQMARAIERAGMVQTSTVWSGFKVTLSTSIAGIVTLLVALLLWMALRTALLHGERTREERLGS